MNRRENRNPERGRPKRTEPGGIRGVPGYSHGSMSLTLMVDAIGSEISTRPVEETASIVVRRLAQSHLFPAASIWLTEPDGRIMVRRIGCGRVPVQSPSSESIGFESSIIGRITRGNFPCQVDSTHAARELGVANARALGLTSFLGFPLVRGRTRTGALCLFSRRWLAAEEMAALNGLARQVAAELAAGPIEGLNPPSGMSGGVERDVASSVDFIARITHELRSPLTSLRGNVQLAVRSVQKGDAERSEKRLHVALQSVDAMAELIQNLHDFSLLERDQFSLNRVPSDLVTIATSAVNRVVNRIDPQLHAIQTACPEDLQGNFDLRRLEQCLFNLISNAVKYSPTGGVIVVRVERVEEYARISIIDDGVGIPLGEQARIFEPYYRSRVLEGVDFKGLGLGLSISHAIIERHGGRIDVESEPGRGSTFIVRLPLEPPCVDGP
jgi:signal transduction histidine kinase